MFLKRKIHQFKFILKLTLLVGVGAGTLGPMGLPRKSALCRDGVPLINERGVLNELGVP